MNELLKERFELSFTRICEIQKECSQTLKGSAADYFEKMTAFVQILEKEREALKTDEKDIEVLRKRNRALYADIIGEAYETSYANPAYAVRAFQDKEIGRMLSFLTAELRGGIVYVYEDRMEEWVSALELLISIYNLFEELEKNELRADVLKRELKDTLYFYISDYSDVTVTRRAKEQLDPTLSFAVPIIMESDLEDLCYLYKFGEYITANEEKTAAFLNRLPEETICKMASVYTEGYRKGFVLAGIDLSKKKTVEIRYEVGFERVVKKAIEQFKAMGLDSVIYRASVSAATKRQHMKIGFFGAYANRQYEFDHRFDNALFLDKAYKERKLSILRVVYEECKAMAAVYAGPACMESFGELPFAYETKEECYSLSDKQKKLSVELANASGEIINQYIHGDERSFTIISWPSPEIGERFEEIFAETITLNTLDYEHYRVIQERLIDALNKGESVHITGRGGNRTDLRVALGHLENPEKETNFENCLADVNIPLGEVFTSPKLEGTNGILHVSQIYLNDVEYRDLEIGFEDGYTKKYSCANYEKEEDNRKLLEENLLYNHKELPMGEFAIGTNTAAYHMAQSYGILDRMQILIIEKMGPHFAIGDTCYSHSEDVKVYNPDGKEIVAKDNSRSLLRKEDTSKAYFNCHTDITIPYSELGDIVVECPDGEKILLIKDGRFVLSGTESLNDAFETN